jgi:Tol biopolymer transport system component
MEAMLRQLGSIALVVASACTKPNPRACADGLCSEPEYPFCDVDGTLEGEPNTCIPVECTPMEFRACRGTTALTCNANGNNYDINQCETECNAASGCVVPMPQRVMYIVFTSDRDGNYEIYRMNPDGTLPTNLTQNAGVDTGALWDPTGERIAFLSTRSGLQQLYTMKPDGTDVQNVSAGQADEPAWSPDGTRLAFTSDRSGTLEIFLTLSTAATVTPLTSLGVGTTGNANWAPDGSKIAFNSEGRINIVSATGGTPTPVTAGAARGDRRPTWDPTGAKIAFSRGLAFQHYDIYVMNIDGSNAVDITTGTQSTTTTAHSGRWSPNGQYVAIEIQEASQPLPTTGTGIYMVNADGTNFGNTVLPEARSPCWSPDGNSLAYQGSTATTAPAEIYVIPQTGGTKANLTNSAAQDIECSWRPR